MFVFGIRTLPASVAKGLICIGLRFGRYKDQISITAPTVSKEPYTHKHNLQLVVLNYTSNERLQMTFSEVLLFGPSCLSVPENTALSRGNILKIH